VRNRGRDFLVHVYANFEKEGLTMLLLVLLALLAIIAFGVGFTVHWLFIVAIVLALIWVIALITGGFGRSGSRL
jgi:hypothetical protein